MVGAFSVHGPHAFLGSNEATYGLREGGAGFHRNRPEAGKSKPTLSAGIVRRVQNADGVRGIRDGGIEPVRIVEADGRAGAPQSVSNRRARSAEIQGSLLMRGEWQKLIDQEISHCDAPPLAPLMP